MLDNWQKLVFLFKSCSLLEKIHIYMEYKVPYIGQTSLITYVYMHLT